MTTTQGLGICFRLYTEESYKAMAVTGEPEILRCSLTSSILNLKCVDQNLEDLDLMDKPDRDSSEISSHSSLILELHITDPFASRLSSQIPLAHWSNR